MRWVIGLGLAGAGNPGGPTIIRCATLGLGAVCLARAQTGSVLYGPSGTLATVSESAPALVFAIDGTGDLAWWHSIGGDVDVAQDLRAGGAAVRILGNARSSLTIDGIGQPQVDVAGGLGRWVGEFDPTGRMQWLRLVARSTQSGAVSPFVAWSNVGPHGVVFADSLSAAVTVGVAHPVAFAAAPRTLIFEVDSAGALSCP
ncbi:MAG: hypothetical protein U1F43_25700 [Myxococcota bacterium]